MCCVIFIAVEVQNYKYIYMYVISVVNDNAVIEKLVL